MSRRYNDQPINLIARIPSPEQMSAARPKQQSFVQLILESGAIWVRRIADMAAQFYRLGWPAGFPMKSPTAEKALLNQTAESAASAPQPVAEKVYLSTDRLARWNALLDATVPRIESDEPDRKPAQAPVARSTAHVVESHPLDEVAALRVELLAHQQEMVRLSIQVQELKSILGAQQQVLAYLGQELVTQPLPLVMAAAQAAPSAKKARVMRAKSAEKELAASRKISREPSLNL